MQPCAAMSSNVGSTLFTLSESHEMLRKTCRDFADRELKPIATELDKTHRYPTEIVRFIVKDKDSEKRLDLFR